MSACDAEASDSVRLKMGRERNGTLRRLGGGFETGRFWTGEVENGRSLYGVGWAGCGPSANGELTPESRHFDCSTANGRLRPYCVEKVDVGARATRFEQQ